jgi:hypothetical protein
MFLTPSYPGRPTSACPCRRCRPLLRRPRFVVPRTPRASRPPSDLLLFKGGHPRSRLDGLPFGPRGRRQRPLADPLQGQQRARVGQGCRARDGPPRTATRRDGHGRARRGHGQAGGARSLSGHRQRRPAALTPPLAVPRGGAWAGDGQGHGRDQGTESVACAAYRPVSRPSDSLASQWTRATSSTLEKSTQTSSLGCCSSLALVRPFGAMFISSCR